MSASEAPRSSTKRQNLASQACESCRRRKIKCDERRPQCMNCERRDGACQYPESVGQKTYQATQDIMSSLEDVKTKLDNLTGLSGNEKAVPTPSQTNVMDPRLSNALDTLSPSTVDQQPGSPALHHMPRPMTTPNEIMMWPAIREFIERSGTPASSEISTLSALGTFWFIQRELGNKVGELSASSSLLTAPTGVQDSGRVHLPDLSFEQASEYSDAYFSTFNVMFPILTRRAFRNDILQHVIRDGYVDGDGRGVIALFVFALGQVAIEGTSGAVLSQVEGKTSGVRGGTALRPPGLDLFNEGRRRIGLILTGNTLEKVQALILQALYFDSGSYYADFWHSMVAASMACQVLIRCSPSIWSTQRGDMIKRVYWTCLINEDFFHIDLDLPRTTIGTMEDLVPLPHFHDATERTAYVSAVQDETFEFRSSNFLALIALRRILTRIDAALSEAQPPGSLQNAPRAILRELDNQLQRWRDMLPPSLQWSDSEHHSIILPPFDDHDMSLQTPFSYYLASDTDSNYDRSKAHHSLGTGYNFDIVTATLRTRFYHARLLIHLPFVYKALHSPHDLSSNDIEGCRKAIASACNWPLMTSTVRLKKRLVPHLFVWTQTGSAILLILRMIRESETLLNICEGEFDLTKIDQAAIGFLDWIDDIRCIDGIAEWSWQIVKPLYFPEGIISPLAG